MLPNRLCLVGLRQLSACSRRPFTFHRLQNSRNTVLPVISSSPSRCRYYSADVQEDYVKLPPLNDDRRLYYPSMLKTLKGFFQIYMIMRPNLDNDFNMNEFLEGSKQALSTVSKALACEDYESLQGLVTNDVLNGLRNKIRTLSDEQKQLIGTELEDIYLQFPYEVGIIIDDDKDDQKTVEITVVFYTLRNLKRFQNEIKEQNQHPLFMQNNKEIRKNCFVCNYRFARTFIENQDTPWIINYINQFSPDD